MIERLLTRLNTTLPYDKALHALSGVVISVMLLIVVTPLWSLVIVALIAALKELYDFLHPPHECSFYDWLATVLGAMLPLIPQLLTR